MMMVSEVLREFVISFLCILVVLPGPTNLRNPTTESRSVSLMWDPPDTTSITVQLVGYSVQVTGTGGVTSMLTTIHHSIVITDLVPYEQYQFSVNSVYQLGNIGDAVSIVVRTRQEGTGHPHMLILILPL